MTNTLLLIDSAPTLSVCRELGLLNNNSQVIAVTKYGLAACIDAGVPYKLIDDYYSRESLVNLTMANYNRLEKFVEIYDRRLAELLPSLAKHGILPFRYSFYDLKILVDMASTKIFQLKALIDATNPEVIVHREEEVPPCVDDHMTFPESLNLYSSALTCLRKSNNFRAKIRGIRAEVAPVYLKQVRFGSVSQAYAVIKLRFARFLASLRPARHSYLTFYVGHDLFDVAPALRSLGFAPRRLPDMAISSTSSVSMHQPFAMLENDGDFQKFFSVERVDYYSLVKERLRHFVSIVLPASITEYERTAVALSRMTPKPVFMLTAAVTRGVRERARMKAGQDAGIPLISYQEGAGFGSVAHPINDYTEVTDGDLFLCYGEGNLAYHDRLKATGRPVKPFLAVGSAEQDRVRAQIKLPQRRSVVRRVMYVGTTVAANRQHHPYNGFTDTLYHRSQRTLFEILESAPKEIDVSIKPHPVDRLTYDYFNKRRSRRFTLVSGPLEACLNGIDLFIVDFPSTTLLACCQTDADIFVLAEPGVTALGEESRIELNKRAFIFEDIPSISKAIQDVMSGKTLEKRRDDSYVRRYGTYRGDGHSAERAAQAIVNYLSERKT